MSADAAATPSKRGIIGRALRRVWYLFFRRHPYHYLGRLLLATLGGDERERLQRAFALAAQVPLRFRARCLLYYLDELYYGRFADSPTLSEPNRLRWSGPLAALTHRQLLEHYSREPGAFERDYGPILARALEALREDSFECVVEVGCGNGLLIERVAAQAAGSGAAFVGLDLDAQTIASNQERYRGSRVQYCCCDSLQEFLERRPPASVLVLAQGTLQLFTEAELLNCLRWLVATIPRGAVVVKDFTYPESKREARSRPAGGFTFFHNYEYLLAQAGLESIRTQVVETRTNWTGVVVSAAWSRRPAPGWWAKSVLLEAP